MQIKYIVATAVVTALATTALFVPLWASSAEPTVKVVTVYEKQPKLTPAQTIWAARLMQCESGTKSGAINPNDVDGTPSYGILQFKPATFTYYAKKYGVKGELMEPTAQVAILEQWILRGIPLKNQFPDCVRKLGAPPNTDSQS